MFIFLGIIAGLLAIAAEFAYLLSIFKGETKPERGAYTIWAITSTIAFFAYWADGAEGSVWFAAGDFVAGLIMLVVAFKYGYGWNMRRHSIALVAVLAGLVLWAFTDEPFLALFCAVLVDAIGAALVMIKSYEAPETEHLGSWIIYLTAASLGLAAVGQWDTSLLFYPAYAVLSALGVCGAILVGRATAKKKKKRVRPPKRIAEKLP